MTTVEDNDNAEMTELSTEEFDKKLAKLAKKIPGDLVEELTSMTKDDLKSRIARCQVAITEAKLAMERDEELSEVKAKAKEMAGPYRDVVKMQKAIADFAALRLHHEAQ